MPEQTDIQEPERISEPGSLPLADSLGDFPFPANDAATAAEWVRFMGMIASNRMDIHAKYPPESWFIPELTASEPFIDAILAANRISALVNTADDVQTVLSAATGDESHDRFLWFILCRRLSTPPSAEREAVFQAIANDIAAMIGNGLSEESDQRAFILAARSLTMFSKKYGAEAFLLGLARSRFTDEKVRDVTLDYLEQRVHPVLYTPFQFFRAARSVYREHLKTKGERDYFNSLFDRMFTPGPEEFTLDEQDIYERAAHLDYSQGDAMLPIDMMVIKRAGITKDMKVIDLAAGEGRHIKALIDEGYSDITAMDINPRYLKQITERNGRNGATLNRMAADWLHMPVAKDLPEEKRYDAAICIGRNILHLVNSRERRYFFENTRAILKKGSLLLLDIADISLGKYRDMVEKTESLFSDWVKSEEWSHMALDSIDNYLYTFRIFPHLEQLINDAQKSGFLASDAHFRFIPDSQGRNLYVVLQAA